MESGVYVTVDWLIIVIQIVTGVLTLCLSSTIPSGIGIGVMVLEYFGMFRYLLKTSVKEK